MSEFQASPERPKALPEHSAVDPLRDVIERMNRARDHIAKADPHLSETIRLLTERADRPGLIEHDNYRTRVAYALMDLEKLAGPVSNMPATLRQEMDRLSTNINGLQNERLSELMKRTPEIKDSGLVRDIRVTATETAQRDVQNGPIVRDRTEALEGRVRLTQATELPLPERRHVEEGIERSGKAAATTNANQPISARIPVTSKNVELPEKLKATVQVDGKEETNQRGINVRVPSGNGLVSAIVSAIHNHNQQSAAARSLDPTPTPLSDRVNAFEQRLKEGRDEKSFYGAEQSGKIAVEAMQSFATGPGAGVMNRIREAAKSDPSGLAGVMAEMRVGGIYGDLRIQFDGAMQREKGFAAAYDRATAAVGQYGKDRIAVDTVATQRPDAEAVLDRFQKLDGQIGSAVSETPGRKDGTSAMEDMAAKAAEILSRAIDRVRAAFSPAARTGSGASPSP